MKYKKQKLITHIYLIILLLSLFTGLLPNQNVRAIIIAPGTYFSIGYTNYTVNVPIDFSQIIINASNITFNHNNFQFRQIPSVSKVNISFTSLIANPLVAVSGNLIVDFIRQTAAIPITVWYNMTGLKPAYVYRYNVDGGAAWTYVTTNASGGIAFSSVLTGMHVYKLYDWGVVLDITPPAITINYAGHLNDKGSPYYLPADGETTFLHANGYYINDSYQYEKFIYINCTVTDASAIAGVTLRWWNVTANTWSNVTAFVLHGAYYDLNYTTGIGGSSKYSFNIRAIDASGNYRNTFWNKTGSLANNVRRYVHLGCTPTNISYTPFYMYSTTYPMGDYGSIDRLNKDQGTKCPPGPMGGINDLGYMKKLASTDTVQRINNSQYIIFWYGEDSSNFLMNNYNLYYHVWWNVALPGTSTTAYFGNTTSFAPNYVASFNHSTVSKTESIAKSSIYYTFGGANTSFYLGTGKKNVSVIKAYTDNNIYELFFGLNGNTKLISNVSFPSYLIWNVPGNATLNASYPDSDLDGLSDWTELYHTYTSPFLADTDADGQTDSYEHLMGSDPNNYRLWYTAPAPPVGLKNPYNFRANWTTSTSLYLSWTKGSLAISTKIVRKLGSYPLSVLDGSIIYNGVGTFVNDTGMSPSDRWFYRGYSFNVSDSTGVNVAMAETDNTSVTTSSSALFKGYLTTDKSVKANYHYSSESDFGSTTINVTSLTDYYNGTSPYSLGGYYNLYWFGQTFRTGSSRFYLYNVSIHGYRSGAPGVLYARLYSANITGLPTGAVLATGTKDVSGIVEWPSTQWITVEMPSYYLLKNTTYAIMFAISGGPANSLGLQYDDTAPMYPDGVFTQSGDGGATFTNNTAYDALFRISGKTPTTYPLGGKITSNSTISATQNYQISQIDLTAGQIYYYYATANDTKGNMTKGNLRYTLTNPDVPTFLSFTPYFANSSMYITWITGNGANRTLIVRGTTSYPTVPTGGTIFYNGTGTGAWFHNISYNTTYKFSLFGFTIWGTLSRFSIAATVPWGGVSFNCFNESSGLPIGYSVLVSNTLGDETYYGPDLYGWTFINVTEIPMGDHIGFYVSNGTGAYNSRLYYYDIEPNIFYNFSFYLPVRNASTPPPGPDSYLYYLRVQETVYSGDYAYEHDLEGVNVIVKRYLVSSGNWVIVGSMITDAVGMVNIYLIPETYYKVSLVKDGYYNATSDYIPASPNEWGQTEVKYFKMVAIVSSDEELDRTFYVYCSLTGALHENNTLSIDYSDYLCNTTNALFKIYEEYNGTLTFLNSTSTTACVFSHWFSITNSSRVHKIVLHLNHTDFGWINITATVNPWVNQTSPIVRRAWIEDTSKDVFGSFPPGYVNFFVIFFPCLCVLLVPGNKNIEFGIVMCGLVLGLISVKISMPWQLLALIPFIVFIGIVYAIVKHGKVKI